MDLSMSEDDIINREEEEKGSPVDNEVLSMEEVLELTKAKPEKRDYPWFVIRKLSMKWKQDGTRKLIYALNAWKMLCRKKENSKRLEFSCMLRWKCNERVGLAS